MALTDKNLDETMAADWAAIQDKYAVEPDAAPEPVPDASPANDAIAEAAPEKVPAAKSDKPRDDAGKFVKDAKPAEPVKTAVKAPGAAQAAPPVEATPETPPPDAAQPQARDVNRAPASWKIPMRAEFDKLPPAVKAEIHRREADFMAGQAQILPDANLGKSMRAVIAPYEMMIQAEGGTPDRAVADLLRTAAIFRVGSQEQKYQAIAQIAQQFGLDLRAFSQQPGEAPAQPQPPRGEFRDPRVDQILAHQRETEQRREQATKFEMESTVTRWMNEQDAQGNPKREYLGDVINEMSALVPQIRQNDPTLTHAQALDAAYERAIWAHPEIRTLLLQKQQQEADAQRRSANQNVVANARRASSVNVPRRASTPDPGKPGRLEDTIADTARALGLVS